MFHLPFQFLRGTIYRNKSIIRGSCYTNPQKGITTGTVNRNPTFFAIFFLHKKIIIQRTTIKCFLYGRWSCDSNKKFNSVSDADGCGTHRRLSPLCSNQSFALILVKISLHQVLIHGSNLANLTTATWSKGTNYKWFRPLIIPPKLLPLERPYIPDSIIHVPAMWITWKINYPLICTWCNLIMSSNRKGIFYVPL